MNHGAAGTALLTLTAVLALIALAGYLVRRIGPVLSLVPGLGRTDAGRRLSVIETLPVDARRRLVLVRCDGRDLLLLLGGPGDLVLSTEEPEPATPLEAG